ncbi:MAG: site-specific integrase [Treponema sp.]|jgi:integrase|nr:site-specific integrase [Treponema sp.]
MGVTVGKYHLFKKTRQGKTFYYYWYQQENERIFKSCGRACAEKREAVAFLEQLLKAELTETKRKSALGSISINDFAKDMFIEGAPHLVRWAAKGKILKRQTIVQHRRHLTGYLLPKFGKIKFSEITPTAVEDFLLEQRLSNSCRNTIIYTLKLIMREARRSGIIEMVPEFEPFKRNGRRQDTLSSEELTALFPYDEKKLIEIWRRPDDMRKEKTEIALMFGTLFCVTVSAGLRSGEVRALHRDQISITNSGLIVDRAIDDLGQIGLLKKATGDDPRSRAVIIPEITLKMLKRWLDRAPECPQCPGLVFSYRGKPIANYYILDRFHFGLKNAGIDYENRRLTPHCLRYTYNTRMRTLLSEQVLREFVGHRSVAMTDHYDRPILMERLAAYQGVKPSVEQFWG